MQYLGAFKLSSPCLLHYLWKWKQIEKIYKESYLVFYIWTVVHRMLMNTAEQVFSKPIIVLHSLLFCPFTFSEFSCVSYLGLLPMLFTYWVVFFQNGEMKALIKEEGEEPLSCFLLLFWRWWAKVPWESTGSETGFSWISCKGGMGAISE